MLQLKGNTSVTIPDDTKAGIELDQSFEKFRADNHMKEG
jgi:hypothetical protein